MKNIYSGVHTCGGRGEIYNLQRGVFKEGVYPVFPFFFLIFSLTNFFPQQRQYPATPATIDLRNLSGLFYILVYTKKNIYVNF